MSEDLSAFVEDLGATWAIPKGGAAYSHAPTVLHKLERLMREGRHERHGRSIQRMLDHWRRHLRHHLELAGRVAGLDAESNVVVSTPFDFVAAAAQSVTCTLGAPYSGRDFLIGDVLVPAELQPRGRFTLLDFAGIDFSGPSKAATTVAYAVGPGATGTPAQQGMGFSELYSNKTSPHRRRHFCPWTGFVFRSDAKILIAVYNPDTANPRSYDFDWMMRSDPCAEFARNFIYHPRHERSEHMRKLNSLHAAIIGLRG
jgi:hypothetical protein